MLNDVYFYSLKVDKVIQLYETMMTRHSSMVIGPTGGGKSVVINTLIGAQSSLGLSTTLHTLNPKVIKNDYSFVSEVKSICKIFVRYTIILTVDAVTS